MAITRIPLILNYAFDVDCKLGFAASVTMKGRVLLEDDGKEEWVYGINPGGLCAHAPSSVDHKKSLNAFNAKLRTVIADLAEEAASFEAFATEVHAAFKTNAPYEAKWRGAVDAVRSGSVDVKGMTRENADTKHSLVISPKVNETRRVDIMSPEVKVAEAA